jgi:undecaprenyl-diphosphatase
MRRVAVTLISLVLVMQGRWRSVVFVVTSVGGMGIITTLIKLAVRRQRPNPYAVSSGHSFPSGHSSGTLVFSGVMTYLLWHVTHRRPVTVLSCISGLTFTLLVGRSRVVLREHHGSDVVAGFSVGAAWLLIMLRIFVAQLEQEGR